MSLSPRHHCTQLLMETKDDERKANLNPLGAQSFISLLVRAAFSFIRLILAHFFILLAQPLVTVTIQKLNDHMKPDKETREKEKT